MDLVPDNSVNTLNTVWRDEVGGAPCELSLPAKQTIPLVFASPHSGTRYPRSFVAASRLDPVALRRSEDAFIDQIFAGVVEHGAPLLRATFPRAYVDPNREPFELDPAMFADPLPAYVNTASPRVAAGLGTVARVVTSGDEIYRDKLSFAEVRRRIDSLYYPYHGALQRALDETRDAFGTCLLIDCHSMPSVGGPMDTDPGLKRVDFVLGDRFGTSCAAAITDAAEHVLRELGYSVCRNIPYAGGYCTRHYGQPRKRIHALQIEINRGLYMDEKAVSPLPGLEEVKSRMGQFIGSLAELAVEAMKAA